MYKLKDTDLIEILIQGTIIDITYKDFKENLYNDFKEEFINELRLNGCQHVRNFE